jgi:iron complex outermembrane receptor protein
MKYPYILFFVFIFIAKIQAQNTLTGSITSLDNNEPLSANIYFPKLEKGTIADLSGNYTIPNIPNGVYTVVYSMLGYASISKKISFLNNELKEVHIQLTETFVEMEEVILSTPFHKLQSDNVMKVERISVDDLVSKGMLSLSEGITNIAGVSSISTGIGIGKPVIRGLSSNRVLTYSQGIRLENQQFGDEHGLGVNASGLESIEIIKGPASLLYGSDAIGGVLYINPEKFAQKNSTKGDFMSSYSSNTLGTSFNFGVKSSGEKLKLLARGAYERHSDYKTGNGYRVSNTRYNEKDFKAGLQFQDSKLKSTLRYNYNRANIGIPEEIGIQSTSDKLLVPFQEIDNHVLSWENKLFLTNSSFNFKAGYVFNDRREFEEGTDPALEMKLNTFSYDLTYNLPELGRFETIIGLQGMFQTNKNKAEEVLIPDAKVTDFGVMGTSHYHLEKVDLQIGLRFDYRSIISDPARDPSETDYIRPIDRSFTSFNGALGAKIDISENIITRVNLASGFRAPNLAELTSNGVHEGTNRYEIGNPDLSNETNFQADVSVEFRNDHFEISANGFYNLVNDFIFISPTDSMIDENIVFNYLQADASLYGGEFGLHIHPHPLHWLHVESSFETVIGKLNNDNYLPLIPANTLRNTFRIEFNDGKLIKEPFSFISLANTFNQKNVSGFETSTPGYNILSIGGGGSLDLDKFKLTFGLNLTNLTDEFYISHLSRLKQNEIGNIGRNINGTLSLQL